MNPFGEPTPRTGSAASRGRILRLRDIALTRIQPDGRFELRVPAFEVARGEFIAVTGESGCGKSTLLDMLALVLRPDPGGRFLFDVDGAGQDIGALWEHDDEPGLAAIRRARLGYVPQSGGLLPFLRVRANLCLPPRLNRQRGYRERIERQAAELGIDGLLDRLPSTLSGGQRQRAAILRAIAHQPALVLADEPTAAVDAARARHIMASFQELARRQRTAIVLVTHDEQLVADACDRHYGFSVTASDERHVVSTCRRLA